MDSSPKKHTARDLTFYFLKAIFYWLTTFLSVAVYKYSGIKFVNFPVNRAELKLKIRRFLKENNLIPEQAVIKTIDYENTSEIGKDNIFVNITYLIKNSLNTKKLFIKFFLRKDKSIFLMAFDNGLRLGRSRELFFYENLASHVPVAIPKFLCGRFDSFSGFGFIVLERIDSARVIHDHQEVPMDIILSCVKKMALIHAKFFDYLPKIRKDFIEKINTDVFQWFLLFKEVRKKRDFVAVFIDLCNYINKLDSTLIHVDFRIGNMVFVVENNRIQDVIIADWQYPCISTSVYDFCYFIVYSLSANLRRQHKELLIDTYLDTLNVNGAKYNKNEFMKDYHVLLFFVVFCAAAYGMVGYFQGNASDPNEDIAWKKRLTAVCLDLDFDLVSKLINVDKLELKNVIKSLQPYFATE